MEFDAALFQTLIAPLKVSVDDRFRRREEG